MASAIDAPSVKRATDAAPTRDRLAPVNQATRSPANIACERGSVRVKPSSWSRANASFPFIDDSPLTRWRSRASPQPSLPGWREGVQEDHWWGKLNSLGPNRKGKKRCDASISTANVLKSDRSRAAAFDV